MNKNMKNKIPEASIRIKPTLDKLKDAITTYYQKRLKNIILYGSYARGNFNQYSDIDILVVLNDIQSEMLEIDALAEIKTDILLDSDIYISTNPVSEEKFLNSNFVFYKNIRNEGIKL